MNAVTARNVRNVFAKVARSERIRPHSSKVSSFFLLNENERTLLEQGKTLKDKCQSLASSVGGDAVLMYKNAQSLSFLQDLDLQASFSIVLAGEFNAGKSTLINALLASPLLESGALPTTDSITIVAKQKPKMNQDTIQLPMGVTFQAVQDEDDKFPLLQDLTFIDTPGTNSAWMDHTERTLRLLPSADLILFVTSAGQPFSESERSLLKNIQAYRKSIVVIVNKMDILSNDESTNQQSIVDFVTDHASELLGARPNVIALSAKKALAAKLGFKSTSIDPTNESSEEYSKLHRMWVKSNFLALETFLRESLTQKTRMRSKLLNPVGVVDAITIKCLETLKEQQRELQADMATLNIIKSQFQGWKKELSELTSATQQNMTQMITKQGLQGEFFLSRISWTKFFSWTLLDSKNVRLNKEWMETTRHSDLVLRCNDLETELLHQVNEMADSLAARGRAQSQLVVEYLGNRPAMRNQSLVGSITTNSKFDDTRKSLTESLSEVIKTTLKAGIEGTENDRVEKVYMFQRLRQLACASSILQAGAVGTGLATFLFELIDYTFGIGISSGLMAGGIGSYWFGTKRLEKQYEEKYSKKAKLVEDAMNVITNNELERVNRKITDSVAPYMRFVEAERDRLENLVEECQDVSTAAKRLRNKIEKLIT